jgi:hypothetical protein
VELRRSTGDWEFGKFVATEEFAAFEPLFREWVQLLFARSSGAGGGCAPAGRMREVERAIDGLHATVRLSTGEEYAVDQINIDGEDVEWVRR